jgi:hypothetical protein
MELLHKVLHGDWEINSPRILFTSPLLHAVWREMRAVTAMLYESGAASNAELFGAYQVVMNAQACSKHVGSDGYFRFVDYLEQSWKPRPQLEHFCLWKNETYRDDTMLPLRIRFVVDEERLSLKKKIQRAKYLEKISNFKNLLEKMATNPRSLMSLCRLKISHCLDPRGRRHRDIQTLCTLTPKMKDYVMFTDLTVTHPDNGKKDETARIDNTASLRTAIDMIQR